MFCTECGSRIEDGFRFCPICGGRVHGSDEFNEQKYQNNFCEETLEDVIKEVIAKYPPKSSNVINELSYRTGIGKFKLGFLVAYVEDGIPLESVKDYHTMNVNYKKNRENADLMKCPRCGSQIIEPYEESGITVSRKANVFGGMYISSSTPGKIWMKCNTCGHRWKPKRR